MYKWCRYNYNNKIKEWNYLKQIKDKKGIKKRKVINIVKY